MSKFSRVFGTLSAASLICGVLSTSALAQANPQDFEEPDVGSPSSGAALPCIEGETCPGSTPGSTQSTQTTAVEPQTTVSCENLATVVRRGDKSAVLVTWKTNEFGGNYTPQTRCQTVSGRFHAAVQANNGSLSGMKLTNGPVNNRMVICALKPGENECSTSNMLFTLKKENERNAGMILGKLLNVATEGSGSPIEENSGEQVVVDMVKWAQQNLRRSIMAAPQRSNTPTVSVPAPKPSNSRGGAF
jgi:hypothetical protein